MVEEAAEEVVKKVAKRIVGPLFRASRQVELISAKQTKTGEACPLQRFRKKSTYRCRHINGPLYWWRDCLRSDCGQWDGGDEFSDTRWLTDMMLK